MSQSFAAIVLGGTGQVGSAAVSELLAIPKCREVVMVTRKVVPEQPRVRAIVSSTEAPDFAERISDLATAVLRDGPVSAISCAGVGSGSMRWSEDQLKQLEVGIVGGFAQGCRKAGVSQFGLLSASGSAAQSRFRYLRIMGLKEDTVRACGFRRLAIFRPGIIAGNAHTPGYVSFLGHFVPGPLGSIEQRVLGRAIAAEVALHREVDGEVVLNNGAMEKLAAELSA